MTEKRRINVGANKDANGKSKMGKPPASWLLSLPNGIYKTKELVQISNKSDRTISGLMTKYAKKVTYTVSDTGKALANYHWDKDHFLKIFYNK